jgi:hypothetical protein
MRVRPSADDRILRYTYFLLCAEPLGGMHDGS